MSFLDDLKNVPTTSKQYLNSRSNIISTTSGPGASSFQDAIATILPGNIAQSMPSNSQKVLDLQSLQIRSKVVLDNNNATDQLLNPDHLDTASFRGRLVSKSGTGSVVFTVSPIVDEQRSAVYDSISPIHHPGSIQVYKTTGPREISISGKFIARTMEEATITLTYMQLIRSWVMPYYGLGTANGSSSDRLGAPPDILEFSLYGPRTFNRIPVVLKSYQWSFPDAVDYIPDIKGNPCPTIIEIRLSLEESYTPEQYSDFDIEAYRKGNLTQAYGFSKLPPTEKKSLINKSGRINV